MTRNMTRKDAIDAYQYTTKFSDEQLQAIKHDNSFSVDLYQTIVNAQPTPKNNEGDNMTTMNTFLQQRCVISK